MNTPDRHLQKALAHAPDGDVTPPPHVSAQILAAAHRQVAEAAPRPTASPAAWWRKPWGASGALATVLMAGVLTLLWQEEPPGPAVDQAAPAPAAAPAANPVPSSSPPAADTTLPTQPARPPARAATPAAAAAPPAQKTAAATESTATTPVQAAAPPPALAVTAAAEPAVPTAQDRAPAAALRAAAPAPAPAAATAAAPAAAPARLAAPTDRPALPSLQAMDRLSWLGDESRPVPDAAWLQQLFAAAGLDWVRWASPPESAPSKPAATLRWQRGGTPLGRLRLEVDALWWCPEGQLCWRVAVAPEVLADLVARLPGTR